MLTQIPLRGKQVESGDQDNAPSSSNGIERILLRCSEAPRIDTQYAQTRRNIHPCHSGHLLRVQLIFDQL
ncbi:hypothetical protein BST61_g7931 [Cercospora zeina]